jgi:hypothetical protein
VFSLGGLEFSLKEQLNRTWHAQMPHSWFSKRSPNSFHAGTTLAKVNDLQHRIRFSSTHGYGENKFSASKNSKNLRKQKTPIPAKQNESHYFPIDIMPISPHSFAESNRADLCAYANERV